jgi:hypothetical protein
LVVWEVRRGENVFGDHRLFADEFVEVELLAGSFVVEGFQVDDFVRFALGGVYFFLLLHHNELLAAEIVRILDPLKISCRSPSLTIIFVLYSSFFPFGGSI